MKYSSEQGVLAWVWDGICKLPKEQQPPRSQRITWALSAQEIWDRYTLQEDVLKDMVAKCDAHSMRMLVVKGFSLSKLYPNPQSRPSGDIDVYFFGDYDKGNDLFAGSQIHENKKHAEFSYRGVTIENHRTLINVTTPRLKTIEKEIEDSLSNAVRTPLGYYELPVESAFVFYLIHAANHFRYDSVKSFTLRHVIDLVFFTLGNEKNMSSTRCKELVTQNNLAYFFDLIVASGSDLLGVDMERYRLGIAPSSDVQKALVLLSRVEDSSNDVETSVARLLLSQWKINKQNAWKLKYLPDSDNAFIEKNRFLRRQLLLVAKVFLGLDKNSSIKERLVRK